MSEELTCAEPKCEVTIKNHYWGKVKSGWYQMKNGMNYCPDHIPAWVVEWRQDRKV